MLSDQIGDSLLVCFIEAPDPDISYKDKKRLGVPAVYSMQYREEP